VPWRPDTISADPPTIVAASPWRAACPDCRSSSVVPLNPVTDISLGVALDDLAWWSAALERARADGELRAAAFRIQAAAAAANQIEDEAISRPLPVGRE
jgi:hypothetical protein